VTQTADLYWSFRSPYSYLGTRRYRAIATQYDVDVALRIVHPLAIRNPGFFEQVNPLWIPYLVRDCARIAEFHGLPFALPSPDPVAMNIQTREISPEQPYIYWLSRLGVEAARRGAGLAFIDEVSSLIWGGVAGWDQGDHLAGAATRAGLELGEMESAVAGNEEQIDSEIAANQDALEAAGHWGVPCLVVDGEPFFGQDRIDLALWRMRGKGLAPRA
jgi:2-hydroxychromene-2-carboxylate isomerase